MTQKLTCDLPAGGDRLTFRQSPDGGPVQLSGLIVPFGVEVRRVGVAFTFEKGSLSLRGNTSDVKLLVQHDDDRPVGYAVDLVEKDDGWHGTFALPDVPASSAAADEAALLLRDGLSVGVAPTAEFYDRFVAAMFDPPAEPLVYEGELLETSLVSVPQFNQARVAQSARQLVTFAQEGEPAMPTLTDPAGGVDLDAAISAAMAPVLDRVDQIEAKAHIDDSPADPLAGYSSIGDVALAVTRGEVDQFALTVNVTGDNGGLFLGSALTKEVQGIVEQRTRVLNAFGTVPLPDKGMTLDWPRNDTNLSTVVATQSSQGDELNSVAISFTKDSANVVTQGAAFRNAWQLLRRSDPSYLTAQLRVAYAAWAYQMEKNAVTAIVGLSGLSTVDYAIGGTLTIDGVLGALVDATFAVEDAVGAAPDVMFAPRAVFKSLALLEDSAGNKVFPYVSPGTNAQGQSAALRGVLDVNGVACIPSPHATANSLFVGHSSAFKVGGGNVNLVAGDVPQNLVTDTAVWGEYAMADYQPTGIVRIYDVP